MDFPGSINNEECNIEISVNERIEPFSNKLADLEKE